MWELVKDFLLVSMGMGIGVVLIKLFVSLFADTYTLDIPFSFLGFVAVFFIFLVGYEVVMYSYKRKLSKTSLKQIMESNL
ncbi:DUF3789 domain-containing protein [[Ruminococcus] torques]|uniref:DUF3789 domain-containing protein n=1 Tax=[Ruminococcus] torques TaxID=33039 RepID=UPI0032BF3D6A